MLRARWEHLTEQYALQEPFPHPMKSLALAHFIEQVEAFVARARAVDVRAKTALPWLPLTALSMLENNAGHYDLAIDAAQRAVKVHRQFYDPGTRVECEGVQICPFFVYAHKKLTQ